MTALKLLLAGLRPPATIPGPTADDPALRAVAEEVSEKAAAYREREGLEPAFIPERVMVAMSSNIEAQRVIRTGARIAGRLGARWYAVFVETRPGGLAQRIAPLRLGGRLSRALPDG